MLLSAAMSTKVICRDSNKEVRKNIGASSSISGSSSAQEPAKSSDQIVLGMLSQLLDRFVPQSQQTQNLDKLACKQPASVNHSSGNQQGQGLEENKEATASHGASPLPLQDTPAEQAGKVIVSHCSALQSMLVAKWHYITSQPFMALHYFSVFCTASLSQHIPVHVRQKPLKAVPWPSMKSKHLQICQRQRQKPRARPPVPPRPKQRPRPKQVPKPQPKARLLPISKF